MQLSQVLHLSGHVSHEAEPISPYPAHVLLLFNAVPFLGGFIVGSIFIITPKGIMNHSQQVVLLPHPLKSLFEISFLVWLLFHQFDVICNLETMSHLIRTSLARSPVMFV